MMHVIDNEPQFWFLLKFLLKDGDDLFLDLRVQSGLSEWTSLIRLSPDEKAAYAAPQSPISGHDYFVKHAETLHMQSQRNNDRNENATLGDKSYAAIMAWIAANPDAPR